MANTAQRSMLPSRREVVTALFKDRRKILWSAGATMAVAVLIALGSTPLYEADSSLIVLLGSEYTVHTGALLENPVTGTLDRDQILKSEIEILSSRSLHEATIRKVGLGRIYPAYAEPTDLVGKVRAAAIRAFKGLLGVETRIDKSVDPVLGVVDGFESRLYLTASKDRGVIEVGYRHPDPTVAADIVNTLVELYIQRRQALFRDVQSSILEGEVKTLRQQLDDADQQLAEFKAKNGISNYDTERDILLRQRGELAKDALDTDSQIAQLKRRLAALTEQLAATPSDVTAYSETNTDQRATTLRQSLADLQGRQASLMLHYKPDSRPVQDVTEQIKARQAELEALRQDKTPSDVRVERNPVHQSVQLDRLRAEGDLDAAEARHNALAAQLAELDQKIQRLSDDEQELDRLTRQRGLIETNYASISKVLGDRRVTEDIDARKAANVRVIQPAEVPLSPRSATRLILLSGILVSLLVGLLVALFADFLRRGFISPEKLERTLGVPVLATLSETGGPRPAGAAR